MQNLKNISSTVLAFTIVATVTVLGALQAPINRLDAKISARGEDPEAGAIGTMEIVIFAAIVLVVVVTVASGFASKITSFFDQVPGD